ncbi:MAG TPA: amidohydrolase family protein [Clostridiaceae bacterium]|nr:amidohydrolase family protein [Clostridiaceae bacterium]
MEPLNFFDCNCSFGMRSVKYPGSFSSLEGLIKNMNNYGIKKALVYHSLAREYDMATGNKTLMREISDYPFLYPVWVVMHHHTGEFPAPDLLKMQLKENNVKAVRIFPSILEHWYSISEWNCGELFNMLEACKIPLIVGFDQITWDELYNLCMHHPELIVILSDVNYRINRNLYTLLKKLPNLYVETSGYKCFDGISDLCKIFGAHRLIFGTGMPVLSGAAAVSMINYAKISDKEKQMIAAENLEKLIGGIRYD